jgi:outer membrane protein OmpA-like peptidoglycan-associated protein
MKHLNKLLFAVVVMLAFSLHAQNSNNPWALSFGVNAVDTRAGADNPKSSITTVLSQPFKVHENWNILPSVSYLSLSRSVGNNLSVGIQGSINKMTKFVYYDPTTSDFVSTNPGNLMYYGIDANVKYSFMNLIGSKKIDPSLRLGGGYTMLGDNGYPTVNAGAGLTFWFTENIGLALETTYKMSQLIGGVRSGADITIPLEPSHLQHTAGLTFQFGGKDTDGDGVYDKDDACPEVAGLKQFNGCPDTDGDGIIDGSDTCPTEFGLAALNGCPDKDGDGIADKDDACPEIAGLASFQGCPDTDGDGIADKNDKCPTVAGPKTNGGCPVLDADKDGVADKDDDCPTIAGLASNKGCPEATPEVVVNLTTEASSVYFESGKSTLKGNGTPARLDAMKEILKNYPNAKFTVEGYTDTDGSEGYNQKLSEARANAVKNALVARGINADNLTAVGLGETKPVATNKTKAGKAKNRRTEVKQTGSK